MPAVLQSLKTLVVIATTTEKQVNRLFIKYYIDITRINILVTVIIGLLTDFILCFGTFGSLISFFVYRQFQNEQYYFYLNQGYSKNELMFKVFLINFIIALILYFLIK
jgi:hypothetical protein